MSQSETREGGCLCGAVRYRIDGPIASVVHCHCHMCRRASGALVATWITVPLTNFAVIHGAPSVYASSKGAERTFCPACGGQLTFRSERYPDKIDVTLGTLDDPASLAAQHHIWTSSRLPAIRIDEHLPTYPGFSPDGET